MKKLISTITTTLAAFAGLVALVYLLVWHAPEMNTSKAINVNAAVETGNYTGAIHPSLLKNSSIIIFGSYRQSGSRYAVTRYVFRNAVN